MSTTGFLDLQLSLGTSKNVQQIDGSIQGAKLTEEGLTKLTEDGNIKITEAGLTQEKTSDYNNNPNPPGTALLDVAIPGSDNVNTTLDQFKQTIFFEATLVDENDSTYMYYGGDKGSDWQIDRVLRTDGTRTRANESNNPTITNLTDAWNTKGTLTYG